MQTRYALVLNKGRMPLSLEFASRVLSLRDRLLAFGELQPEDLNAFIGAFGTHYPYAVTYGGMALLEKEFTETELESIMENGSTLSENLNLSAVAQYGTSDQREKSPDQADSQPVEARNASISKLSSSRRGIGQGRVR